MSGAPRFSLLLLVLALLWGQWLLADHDHPLTGKAGGDTCQFCLHVPLAKGAAPVLAAPPPPVWVAPMNPGLRPAPLLAAASATSQARAPPGLSPRS